MNLPAFVLVLIILLVSAPLIYLASRTAHDSQSGSNRLAAWLAVTAFVAAWVPFVMAVQELAAGNSLLFTLGSVSLVFDGVSVVVGGVALALGTLVAIYSAAYVAGEVGEEKYHTLLLILVGVIIGLGCARDLFNLWVWFEAMAMSTFLLVAFYREQPGSIEAGVKYLVQSAVGSALVLLGIALTLMQTGTLDLAAIQAKYAGQPLPPVLVAAAVLFFVGFGVKAALVPLHTWLPDAHSQAPSGISAMLSGIVIEAGLIAIWRTFTALGTSEAVSILLMIAGAVNMLVGNLLALRQTEVKRLLAYSSLSHVGYMLLGLGIAASSGETAGTQGAFFHLITHGLMKGLAFLAAGVLLYTLHIAKGDHHPLTVEDLSGAARRYPLPALALSVAVLGLGGLPPLAGFMSKWQIFVAGFTSQNALTAGLVIFAAANSVLSLAYYAPLVNMLYKQTPSTAVKEGATLRVSQTALLVGPVALMGAAVLLIGLWPTVVAPLLNLGL
jgi:proton-translocating NADH-quinone oxidoreductase chain N